MEWVIRFYVEGLGEGEFLKNTSLFRAFFEARTSTTKSKLKEVALLSDISSLDLHLAELDNLLHIASLGSNNLSGDLEILVIIDLDLVFACKLCWVIRETLWLRGKNKSIGIKLREEHQG